MCHNIKLLFYLVGWQPHDDVLAGVGRGRVVVLLLHVDPGRAGGGGAVLVAHRHLDGVVAGDQVGEGERGAAGCRLNRIEKKIPKFGLKNLENKIKMAA